MFPYEARKGLPVSCSILARFMAIAALNGSDLRRKEDCNCLRVPEQAAGETVRVCR